MPSPVPPVESDWACFELSLCPLPKVLHRDPGADPAVQPQLAVVVSDGVLFAARGPPTATATVLHDVQLAGSGQRLLDVPETHLTAVASAAPALLREARLAAAATAAAREAVAAPPTLAPTPAHLAQVATAAADAMRSITVRVPCAVCCCSVQEADTAKISVSDAPPDGWHTKLKAKVAMNLHPELRAQYDLGAANVDANVHPDWRAMLLYPPSLYESGTDDWSVDVCTSCANSLNSRSQTGNPPKSSIANGNYRGFVTSVPELAAVPETVRAACLAHSNCLVSLLYVTTTASNWFTHFTFLRVFCSLCIGRRGRCFGTASPGPSNACACPSTRAPRPQRCA